MYCTTQGDSRQTPALRRPAQPTRLEQIDASPGDVFLMLFQQFFVGEKTTFPAFTRVLKRQFGDRFDDRWAAYLNGNLEAAEAAGAQ